jgi:hypothetical protein
LFIYSTFIEHLNCARPVKGIQEKDMKLYSNEKKTFYFPYWPCTFAWHSVGAQ